MHRFFLDLTIVCLYTINCAIDYCLYIYMYIYIYYELCKELPVVCSNTITCANIYNDVIYIISCA